MYWPDTGTGVDTEPARKPVASAVRKYFTEGGLGQAPTVPGGDWFNQMTNEVLNVLAAAGIEPSKTADDQLLQAIRTMSGVTAESFGVVSGLVSLSVARTNANKIMAKAAELSAAGGGKIIFTKSLYQVHMDESDFSTSPTNLRVAALKIPFDNVILKGQGWTATTIQAYAENSSYGVVQWTETPQENGITKVFGVGLHDICIDGNYQGDFTPSSYVRQTEGVLGAGIEGLNIRSLKVKNCSHYGMGLQNGGYKGCSIDGYWSENTGADGIDIKDNGSVSRAFQLNNIFVFNFGQLDEPANPWAGVDVMSLAPQVLNVLVSDFGDKGQPGAAVRIKQGPIGDLVSRGTGGAWANVFNITAIQNKFKAGVSEVVALHIKAPNVNYGNVVAYGDGGKIGAGVHVEERYCQGTNIQVAHADEGYYTSSASGASDRVYGDADACTVVGLTIVDTNKATRLDRKYQKLKHVTIKDCPIGLASGGPNAGKVIVEGLHLDNVADPFGQLQGSFHHITGVTGPSSENWQAGVGVVRDATDFLATAILSKISVRLYTGSTEDAPGVEVARFRPVSTQIFSPLVVTGNVLSSSPNTGTIGTGPTPWAGGFTQTAFAVTSDERLKVNISSLLNSEEEDAKAEFRAMRAAWRELDLFMYQLIDRVEKKSAEGKKARWHLGIIAQRAIAAFVKHGLDWTKYSIFNYDKWDSSPIVTNLIPAVFDEHGNELEPERVDVLSPAIEAGDIYTINYEEAFILAEAVRREDQATQDAFNQTLLVRLTILESKLNLGD